MEMETFKQNNAKNIYCLRHSPLFLHSFFIYEFFEVLWQFPSLNPYISIRYLTLKAFRPLLLKAY